MTNEQPLRSEPAGSTPRDLRSFLDILQTEGRVLNIEEATSPEPDIGAYCKAASGGRGSSQSLLFENIVGYKGMRLAVNLLASWGNCAVMAGLPSDTSVSDLVTELCDRSTSRVPQRELFKDPPSHECVETTNVDLYKILPLFRVHPQDGGFYLHKACIVSPDFNAPLKPGRVKCGTYSAQVQGRDMLGIHLYSTDNLSIHLRTAERLNRPLPVAVCLGVPPLCSLVASMGGWYETSEYDLVSALSGSPIELAHCLTSELVVPAFSEIVLEGYIQPGLRSPLGPVTGDRGRVSKISNQPQIKVTAIAHRKNPILDNAYPGVKWTERDCVAGITAALRINKYGRETLVQVARSGTRAENMFLQMAFSNLFKGDVDPEERVEETDPECVEQDVYLGRIEELRRRSSQCHKPLPVHASR
jgi:UbiD family decarboxylase